MQRPPHDITIGDRAPNFALPVPDGKFYQFYERTRGGQVVLLFAPKIATEAGDQIKRFVERHNDFKVLNIDIFAISLDSSEENCKLDLPFLVWSDPKQAITTHYLDGAGIPIDQRDGVTAFLLDANQRVLAIQSGAGTDCADVAIEFYQALPSPPPPLVITSNAPVIMMPNLIDRAMCRDLIKMWQEGGNEEGGVTSVLGDDEVHRLHLGVKKRRDHAIMDPGLHGILQGTLGRRIAPEVEKAFQFSGFRFDRFVIGCYDAGRGDYFRPHRDNLSPESADRAFAMTLNLNTDDYTGGELVFPEYGQNKYRPESGGGVVFSCSLIHEALPTTTGRRFVLLTFLRLASKEG